MKRTFCDGCREEITSSRKALEIEHTFPNGVSIKAKVSFASNVNGAQMPDGSRQMINSDGDFCDTCLLQAVQEGWPE